MSLTQTYTGFLTVVTCDCGVTYGLDNEFIRARREDHKTFYCPNGCSRWYGTKNEKELLEQRLRVAENDKAMLQRRNDNLHNELTGEKYKVRAEKAAKTRLKNRVKNGVCPCCNRTFQNLHNHMKNEHPDFVKV